MILNSNNNSTSNMFRFSMFFTSIVLSFLVGGCSTITGTKEGDAKLGGVLLACSIATRGIGDGYISQGYANEYYKTFRLARIRHNPDMENTLKETSRALLQPFYIKKMTRKECLNRNSEMHTANFAEDFIFKFAL